MTRLGDSRKDRLAKALRENLKRRKARERALGLKRLKDADSRSKASGSDVSGASGAEAPGRNPAAKPH